MSVRNGFAGGAPSGSGRLERQGLRAMHTVFRIRLLLRLALAGGVAASGLAVAQESPETEPPSISARMLEELSSAYASLAALVGDNPAQAVGWAQEDVENLGDWEYRIVEFDDADTGLLETELNALGNERWEVYWVASARDTTRFFLKRPALSYLSRVPVSTLLRLLGAGGAP
jgi:hypothetical protein